MDELPLEEELLPQFDVSDAVARTVETGTEKAWEALLAVDLIALGRRRPLVGALGGVRIAPEIILRLLHGERLPPPPDQLTLGSAAAAGAAGDWALLAERPGRAIGLGLVGRFWRPVIEYRQIEPGAFAGFAEPGWAKAVYCLTAEPIGPGRTQLRGTMRTATTDARSRRRFGRYWACGAGAGARYLAAALLEAARDDAESADRVPRSG